MHDQNSEDKNIQDEKTFNDEIKSIMHHFKGLFLNQIKPTFLKGESPTLRIIYTEF